MPQIITPTINAHRLTGVAPLAITFDALATSIPGLTSLPFSEIQYDWDFGDYSNGETWDYGTNPGGNLKNEASGPVAAHVFKEHGTYTVTCKATHRTAAGVLHVGSANLTVTVTDPNVVFAANTICISQNSLPVAGQNGVPAGSAVQQVSSWSTVATLAQTYKRILLKRGDVWTGQTAGVELNASHAGPGIIGAYGTGNKPEISSAVSISHMDIVTGAGDWRVMDIFFTGASVAERTWSRGIYTNGAVNALFLRTDVRWATTLTQTENSDGLYLVDCSIGLGSDQPGVRSYGNISGNISRSAFIGSRFFGVDSFTIRWQGADRSVLSNSTLDAPKGPDSYSRFAVRGKSNSGNEGVWNGLWSENIIVSDNYMVGDATTQYAVMGGSPQNTSSAERIRNVIFERNFAIHVTGEPANFFIESLTVRNNLLVTLGGSGMGFNIQGTLTPEPTQGWIYNNTFYRANTSQGPWFSAINVPNRVAGYSMSNNIAYAPGSTGPSMFSGAGVEGVNFTQSNNSSNAQILSTRPWASATPTTHLDFAPSSSYASNSGVYVPVFSDFYGSPLNGTRNMGALRMPDISVGSPRPSRSSGRALIPVTLSSRAPVQVSGTLNTSNMGAIAGTDFIGQVNVPFSIPRGYRRVVVNVPLIYSGVDLSVNAYVETGYVDDYFEDDIVTDLSINAYVETGYIDDYFEGEVTIDLSTNSYVEDGYVDDYVV